MADFDLKINDTQLREIIKSGIFAAITPEKRDELVKAGIESLLLIQEVSSGSYGNKKQTSKMGEAFEQAIYKLCNQLADEIVNEPENRARLRTFVLSAFEKMLMADYDSKSKLTDSLSKALAQAFVGRD